VKAKAAVYRGKFESGFIWTATASIDGIAAHITKPRGDKNAAAYFSGHKQIMCINVQAVCDVNLNFIAFTCMHKGSTHDAGAYKGSELERLCSQQPFT
jgi:hypothetical protein